MLNEVYMLCQPKRHKDILKVLVNTEFSISDSSVWYRTYHLYRNFQLMGKP